MCYYPMNLGNCQSLVQSVASLNNVQDETKQPWKQRCHGNSSSCNICDPLLHTPIYYSYNICTIDSTNLLPARVGQQVIKRLFKIYEIYFLNVTKLEIFKKIRLKDNATKLKIERDETLMKKFRKYSILSSKFSTKKRLSD